MKQVKIAEKLVQIIREKGVLRPRDLDEYKIPREYLRRLHQKGIIKRVGRGLYTIPDENVSEHHTMILVAKKVPNGIVCLLSALQYHGLTTQMPHSIWMAIDHKARQPQISGPQVRFVRFSGTALVEGVEEHIIDSVTVKIYSIAKTIADCFKFRNKIGLNVALEALSDCLKQKKCHPDDLMHYARICRVSKIMKPYLEALLQ